MVVELSIHTESVVWECCSAMFLWHTAELRVEKYRITLPVGGVFILCCRSLQYNTSENSNHPRAWPGFFKFQLIELLGTALFCALVWLLLWAILRPCSNWIAVCDLVFTRQDQTTYKMLSGLSLCSENAALFFCLDLLVTVCARPSSTAGHLWFSLE